MQRYKEEKEIQKNLGFIIYNVAVICLKYSLQRTNKYNTLYKYKSATYSGESERPFYACPLYGQQLYLL